jgi:hypothetical protein
MKSDLILLVFAVIAIALAGAAMHGGRKNRPPQA